MNKYKSYIPHADKVTRILSTAREGQFRLPVKEGKESKYQEGDIIYIREYWSKDKESGGFIYLSDWTHFGLRWNIPMYMPRTAARVFLEITGVKQQKLQDITNEEALKEGFNKKNTDPFEEFMTFWYKKYGSDYVSENPLVWVYDYKLISKPSDF